MKKVIKSLAASGGAAWTSLSLASAVWAANNINLRPIPEFNNVARVTPQTAISAVIRLLLIVAFVIALIFLIIGGIRWILAGGDKAAAESARGTLTAAIIGLIIVLVAWAIMFFIEQLFGVSIVSRPVNLPTFY